MISIFKTLLKTPVKVQILIILDSELNLGPLLWPPLGAKLQGGVRWGFNPNKYIYQTSLFSIFSLERIIQGLGCLTTGLQWGLHLLVEFCLQYQRLCSWNRILTYVSIV